MQIKKVLVFPCGTEIAQEIHAALKYEKSVQLFGASSVEDHGRMVFAGYSPDIPFIGQPGFDEALEACIQANNIDFVIPAHDSAVLYLAEHRDKFSAQILTASAAVCRTCRSKKATYEALAGEDFTPGFFTSPDDVTEFPVFLKPDVGQGSQGIMLAEDRPQLHEAVRQNTGLLICENLPGKEYTVDCYSNKNGDLLFSGPRERIRTKAGISVHSRTVTRGHKLDQEIRKIGERISARLGMTGMWFFQVKEANDGKLKLMEVAPRIAGTMALHRVQGINFALMALFEAQGFPVSILTEPFTAEIDRALINRYKIGLNFKVLYLDLDDTLIVHDRLNMTILRLVYQCQEKGIPIKLITRHFQDPLLTLEKFKLHTDLFTEIIWITDRSHKKSAYMQAEPAALFIDDSFKERTDVAEMLRMPVMAPDAAEALIDWCA